MGLEGWLLRAYNALAEDPRLVPSAHVEWLTTT